MERLDFNSYTPDGLGFPPYPRPIPSVPSTLPHRLELETLYDQYKKDHQAILTEFLTTDAAKQVFAKALSDLQTYKVKFPENQPVLVQALDYFNSVPDHYVEQCPAQ